ncbi:CocE/NonD family hydrolase [Luteimonas abyssi]|uniref:CocE/NonD family hydrolase n=1 Tax=Luteimonas abyssi TaxID=1247514 RepID=UPI000737D7A1|nr:CocE/NonD family hydrolase [Luteimonas abyssi]
MPRRLLRSTARPARRLFAALVLALALPTAFAATPPAPPPIIEADLRAPMRDGTELSVRVWRPSGDGRHTVVMQHTPYLSDETHARAMKFVAAGFAYASVDRRGRGTSGGEFRPMEGGGPDGADAARWLANRPWSDGRVAMMGGSYRGTMQWQAMAEDAGAIQAAVPTASAYPGWDFPQPRGIFLGFIAPWLGYVDGRAGNAQWIADTALWQRHFERAWRGEIAFADLATVSGVPQAPFARWLAHPTYDAYWQAMNPTPPQYAAIDAPVLSITGYFDGDQDGTLRYYDEHLAHATRRGRANHWLLIGPWSHAGTRYPTAELGGLTFDQAAVLDLDALQMAWFKHVLDGAPRPDALPDRVTYYVMGAETWRSAPSLEAVAPHTLSFQLSAGGLPADDVFRSGRLQPGPAGDEPPSAYRFDPRRTPDHPTPRPIGEFDYTAHGDALQGGQLFFHSAPLPHTQTLCGRMTFDASIELDVPDTDVQVEVYQVTPRNELRWLGRDIQRARFRHGMDAERLATPGDIDTWRFDRFPWTCRELEQGSRLRLVIAPVDTPELQRNFNSGGRIGHETLVDAQVATVRLHHSAGHPSVLRLPVVEAPSELGAE